MKIRPEIIYIEFDSGTPIPPDQILILTQPDGWLVVKVVSNQKQIEGGFTIRGRMIALNSKLMETKQIKELLAGQGLSKQEVEIILGAIKGVKIAPLAYSEINAMTEEVVSLKEFRTKTQEAIGALGLGGQEPKKERKPRSDKGTTKGSNEAPAKMEVSKTEPVKEEPVKVEKTEGTKKAPVPRKVKASDADKTKGKESSEDIKANIANLGGDEEIPL